MPLSPMDPRHFQAAPRPVGSAPAHVQVAPLAQTDRHYRIPTIEEAFPYTPLSSILPFDADVIPAPRIAPSSINLPSVLSTDQKAASVLLFQSLDAEADKAERASVQLQDTLSDFQTLLQPASLTQIQFKQTRRLSTQPATAVSSANGDFHRLGSFAKMALERTNLAGRYPTPVSPTRDSIRQSHVNGPDIRPAVLSRSSHGQRSDENGIQNGEDAMEMPSSSQQLRAVMLTAMRPDERRNMEDATGMPPSSQRLQAVMLTAMGPNERSEFVTIADHDLEAPPDYVKTRQHMPVSPAHNDLRKKVQVALKALQTNLSEIAEAELSRNEALLQVREIDEGSVHILQFDAQKQLDKLVANLSSNASLSLLPVDAIADVQRLCSTTIRSTSSVSLFLGESWDEQAVQEWSVDLRLADQALIASRTTLRTMIAGHDDQHIVSEELLRTLLELISRITDTCIVPVVELRFSAEKDSGFQVARSAKQPLLAISASLNRVMQLFGTLLHGTDIDETIATTVASLCRRLVFVENAPAERDSALGIQSFEKTRKAAMDVLAKIFSRHKSQRRAIFVDVLTSLEHLPVTRQSARQFRLPDAKPIQLVSALLMRLVQSSATRNSSDTVKDLATKARPAVSADDSEDEDEDYPSDSSAELRQTHQSKVPSEAALGSLEDVLTPLLNAASWDAAYAVNYLLDRALKSTKSSDEPYRNLLDIFVEDFISVLGLPEWPAAELFLRHFTAKLYEVTEGKSSAPAKTMALELLGATTSSILELRLKVRKAVEAIQERQTSMDYALYAAEDALDRNLLALTGPYRVVLEHLRHRGTDNDAHTSTACGFHVAQWAERVANSKDGSFDSNFVPPEQLEALKDRLTMALTQGGSMAFDTENTSASIEEARICSTLITLRSPYCDWFDAVLNKLLTSMSTDQPSIRSKALKTVDQVLEKDPSLLDRGNIVLGNITKCLGDSSPQVKDSALGLLNKCLLLRPQLEATIYKHIAALAGDPAIGVKKRAMKMLKELYLRNQDDQMRSTLASALVMRISDDEESVKELAKQTLEDIWIAPLHAIAKDTDQSSQPSMPVRQQASMLVGTVQQTRRIVPVLLDLLVEIMSPNTKSAKLNTAVCRQLVLAMVDAVVSENELPGGHPRQMVMQTLSVFVQAKPQLFTSVELQPLLPYLKNIKITDNSSMYRYTIIILRHTLPHMKNLSSALLEDTQSTLLSSTSKLPAGELKEVTSCLWTLTELLNNRSKLVLITRSALEKLAATTQSIAKQQTSMGVIRKLALLVGHFVSTFDLDDHIDLFREKFKTYSGTSLVELTLGVICPLMQPAWLIDIRLGALASICRICNTHPKRYLDTNVCDAIQSVFDGKEVTLEKTVLEGLLEFFAQGTDKLAVKPESTSGRQDLQAGTDRITSTYVATDRDGASTSLAQRFFDDIKRLALASTGELALLSAKVIAAINQSGLMHPRDSAPCLVALETCPITEIAEIAHEQHKSLFSRHETMFEKENMRAVQQAYVYQRDVVGDSTGCVGAPAVAKLRLFWDVVTSASTKVRKRFLTNICNKLDFDPAKLDFGDDTSGTDHLDLVRFCSENLALFDYTKVEDLMTLVVGLERVVSATGATFAHDIDALAPVATSSTVESNGPTAGEAEPGADGSSKPDELAIDTSSLRRLAAMSCMMTILWETRSYIYKVWSLDKHASSSSGRSRQGEEKIARETGRAPQRIPNTQLLTQRYLVGNSGMMSALSNREGQISICRKFAHIMSIDEEARIPTDDLDGTDSIRDGTPGPDATKLDSRSPSVGPNGRAGGTPSKRGRKRKSGAESLNGTPHKKRTTGRGSTGTVKQQRRSSQHDNGDDDDDFTG